MPRILRLSPRSALWVVCITVFVFMIVSLGVLLSDVNRDDVVAMHEGLDGSTLAQADVGSFFEVSSVDGVSGPVCNNNFPEASTATSKKFSVVNKLGETLPILISLLDALGLMPTGSTYKPAAHLTLQVRENSVTFEDLWAYTRDILNSQSSCGQLIEKRTKRGRDVRICPVHRVWKDLKGRTIAVFFDPYAINSCRDSSAEDCSDECPRFDNRQLWTKMKTILDLIEDQDHGLPNLSHDT